MTLLGLIRSLLPIREQAASPTSTVTYTPLTAEQRILRIVEVERALRRGGLRGAATQLVQAEEQLRFYQAALAQWQDVQEFRQFLADMKAGCGGREFVLPPPPLNGNKFALVGRPDLVRRGRR